jgi:hypothetical protein
MWGLVVLALLLAAGYDAGAQAADNSAQGERNGAAKTSTAAVVSEITIVRQPGHEDGIAQMTENGKVHKIAPHAVAAWKVRDGVGH